MGFAYRVARRGNPWSAAAQRNRHDLGPDGSQPGALESQQPERPRQHHPTGRAPDVAHRSNSSFSWQQRESRKRDVRSESRRLDGVLSRFYLAHKNKVAGMQDMIDAIKADTGFDPTPIAQTRLRKKF